MLATLKFLSHDESAVAAVEYGLLLALVALAAMVALLRVGTHLDRVFDRANGSFGIHR